MRMNEEQQEANNIPLKNKENKKNTTCYENLLNQSMRRSLWVANTKTKTLFVFFFLFSFVSRGFLDRRKQNKDIFSVPSLFPFFFCFYAQIRNESSQEPVANAVPVLFTPRQLTRFSCDARGGSSSCPLITSQARHAVSSYPPNNRRPECENATDVMDTRSLSDPNVLISPQHRVSNMRAVLSSDPVAKANPSGNRSMELMSESCPSCVCTHFPDRASHTLAVQSQPPEMNVFC